MQFSAFLLRTAIFIWVLATIPAVSPCRQRSDAPGSSRSNIFRFRVGFWANLHQFAYVLGRAHNGAVDSKRRAVAGAPAEESKLQGLAADDSSTWNALIRSYQNTWSRKDPIGDRDLANLTLQLAQTPDISIPAPKAEDQFIVTLRAAAPIYRRVWWRHHSSEDYARIDELQRLVDGYGRSIVEFLEKKYEQVWPLSGFRVEVSAYANWAGAYSTENGLIVISSSDPGTAGDQGLETVFHEAMHQWDDATTQRINQAARQLGMEAPGALSHSLIFYTAGYAVCRAIPNHQAYADVNGLWARGGLVSREILDSAWLPYLRGTGNFDEALRAVLTGLKMEHEGKR